jgi:PAS domain S-box-containing protein
MLDQQLPKTRRTVWLWPSSLFSSFASIGFSVSHLMVGLALSGIVALWAGTIVHKEAELRFDRDRSLVVAQVAERLQKPIYGLRGGAGLYAASQAVDRTMFGAYVASRNLAQEFPGVRGLGFIQRLQRGELSAFLKAARADGAPQFALRQLTDTSNEDLYVIKYIEPAANNTGAQGLDVGSEAHRRAAIQRAIDTGKPAMTNVITLVQDTQASPGVLIFVPVYARGANPTTVAERRAALRGAMYAPIVMAELLVDVNLVKDSVLDIELFDGKGTLLFDSDGHTLGYDASPMRKVEGRLFSTSQTLAISGQELTLRISSASGFKSMTERFFPIVVFGVGTLLSALVSMLLRQQTSTRERAEALAAELTLAIEEELAERKKTETALRLEREKTLAALLELKMQQFALDQHAIVATTDVQGKITYVNDKFCNISGYRREELIGENHSLINSGTHPRGFFKDMYRTLASGKTWRNEVCNRAKNGELYWVDTTIVPILNGEGKPEKYLAIRADISMRKQVEQDLIEHQLDLERRVKQKSQDAIQSAKHLRLVLDTSLDAVVVMDSRGNVNDWNRQAEVTFGWQYAEVLGKPLHDFIIPERYREAHQKGLAHYLAHGVGPSMGKRIQIAALRRDGSEFPVELAISSIVTAQGTAFSAFISDVSERASLEEARKQAEFLREQAMELGRAGYWTIDFKNNPDYFISSDRVVSIFGDPPREGFKYHIMNDWYAQIAAADPAAADATMGSFRATIEGQQLIFDTIHPYRRPNDGRIIWVHVLGEVVRDASGQATQLNGVVTDVTALKTAELGSQAASLAKSEFLANMSHEIRTPLNGVVGMVDILQETELSPAQHRMLETIHDSSLSLLQILNDILDFSKIEAGKLDVETVPVHLREVAESVAQLMASSSGRVVDISLFVSPLLPDWILSDGHRLRQVLINLLGNAVKFTGILGSIEPRVRLSVVPCLLKNGGDGVCFDVVDSGIGMAPEVVESLFQPFHQADESTARKFGGTGLGLSICQRLVDLMGGRISVKSTLGKGSEFSVELPLREATGISTKPDKVSLTGIQVLLVGGDAFSIAVRTAYCEHSGATVCVAPDIEAAKTIVRNSNDGQGWVVVVAKTIVQPTAELGFPAPVGFVREVIRGSQDFPKDITLYVRPMLREDLVRAVVRASAAHGSDSSSSKPLETERRTRPRLIAPTVEEAVQSRRLILLAEDNSTNLKVMKQQLHLLGYACEIAEDGALALDMWGANPGRYALLLTDCHMPNLDGFGLTDAIRKAEPADTRLPIIAVTANAMAGEAQRCCERGMDDYLAKPLRMQELSAMLDKWLPPIEELAKTANLVTPLVVEVPTPGAPIDLQVWNASTLRDLVGDDLDLQVELLNDFLRGARQQTAQIITAAAASDTSTLAGVAHTMKSAARTVGALSLGELCQRLETDGMAGNAAGCRALAGGLESALAVASRAIEAHLERAEN